MNTIFKIHVLIHNFGRFYCPAVGSLSRVTMTYVIHVLQCVNRLDCYIVLYNVTVRNVLAILFLFVALNVT